MKYTPEELRIFELCYSKKRDFIRNKFVEIGWAHTMGDFE